MACAGGWVGGGGVGRRRGEERRIWDVARRGVVWLGEKDVRGEEGGKRLQCEGEEQKRGDENRREQKSRREREEEKRGERKGGESREERRGEQSRGEQSRDGSS